MSITAISRNFSGVSNLVKINSSDATATCIAANYITAQAANIAALNNSEVSAPFQWNSNDIILLSASDGLSWCSINSTFTTLSGISGVADSTVTYSGALVSGDIPQFSGTSGVVIDSGVLASNVVKKNAVNQMAAASEIILDKGTGTVSAGAVTINHQAGVITGTFTTAAAGTTVVTFNNSFIASTSVILLSLMGGSNVIPGVQLSCSYTSAGIGSLVVTNNNVAGSALSGTLIIGFTVLNEYEGDATMAERMDGEAGAVENKKDEHYVAMPKSWEARNNMEMNKGMGYGNMADLANTPHPATRMEGEKRNMQMAPKMPGENEFYYNKNR